MWLLLLIFDFSEKKCGVFFKISSFDGRGDFSFFGKIWAVSGGVDPDFELPLVECSPSSFGLCALIFEFWNFSFFLLLSRHETLSSAFSSLIEWIKKFCLLLTGLRGFNNLGCSITLEFFLSDINFIFENISLELFGWPKKSSGNIFLVGYLYNYYNHSYFCLQ